jgi:hypothetical protein
MVGLPSGELQLELSVNIQTPVQVRRLARHRKKNFDLALRWLGCRVPCSRLSELLGGRLLDRIMGAHVKSNQNAMSEFGSGPSSESSDPDGHD